MTYRDEDWLRKKYWDEGLSTRAIGRLASKNERTICNWLRKYGIPRRNYSQAQRIMKRSPEHCQHISEAKRGERNSSWKGGRRRAGERILLLAPDNPMADSQGYVRRSRLVVSRHIGRPLEAEEIVHHVNGDMGDDSLENLQLLPSRAEHTKLHHTRRRRW